jgi:hypothetical protein
VSILTSDASGVSQWLRPEDGAWDTLDANRYYFVTTDAIDRPSRLWALDFYDVKHPEWGGRYTALLDGTEGQQMLDNIAVAADGKLVLQEDPGNYPGASKVWQYDPQTDTLREIAKGVEVSLKQSRKGEVSLYARLTADELEDASDAIETPEHAAAFAAIIGARVADTLREALVASLFDDEDADDDE